MTDRTVDSGQWTADSRQKSERSRRHPFTREFHKSPPQRRRKLEGNAQTPQMSPQTFYTDIETDKCWRLCDLCAVGRRECRGLGHRHKNRGGAVLDRDRELNPKPSCK